MLTVTTAIAFLGAQAFAVHQTLHTMFAACLAQIAPVTGELAIPVHRATLQSGLFDKPQDAMVVLGAFGRGFLLLGIEPTGMKLQYFEHAPHRP